MPGDLAVFRVHRVDAPAGLQQHPLRPRLGFLNRGRSPVGRLRTGDLPQVRPAPFAHPGGERLAVVLHLRDQHPAGEHERRRHAQAVAGVGIIDRQAAQPLEVAVEVEAEQVVGGKKRKQPTAIGHRRGRGDACFVVAHRAAHRPELALPNHRAVGGIEAENLQPVLPRAAAGRHEHAGAHDQRTREPPARQVDPPRDVLLRVKRNRQPDFIRDTVAQRPAKAGPVARLRAVGQGGNSESE